MGLGTRTALLCRRRSRPPMYAPPAPIARAPWHRRRPRRAASRDARARPGTGARPCPITTHALDRRVTSDPAHGAALPRKEVIQPQLPLRLPCYDFVPITSPTLDGCLPCGLAHRLQVLPAFMT